MGVFSLERPRPPLPVVAVPLWRDALREHPVDLCEVRLVQGDPGHLLVVPHVTRVPGSHEDAHHLRAIENPLARHVRYCRVLGLGDLVKRSQEVLEPLPTTELVDDARVFLLQSN